MKNRISKAFRHFIELESFAGILLFFSAVLAILIENSNFSSWYDKFLHFHFGFSIFGFEIYESVLYWINDALMAIFFLLVGLEIKREFVDGELSNKSQAALPAFAALGGMAIPASLYLLVNYKHPEVWHGWAIPSATDIAFSLGILSLLGSTIPASLKVFLTALAIIDDLGAIIIIAIFYTASLSYSAIGGAAICLSILFGMNKVGQSKIAPYLVIGALLWLFVLKSGVHATLAGVVLGLCIPFKDKKDPCKSPIKYLEYKLHSWVAYLILPLFAFANAGINFTGMSLNNLVDPVPLGIILGLVLGKAVGVFIFSWILIKLKIASLPTDARWRDFIGVCFLTGVGFTMSLFIASLAFKDVHLQVESRLGILTGSLLAGTIGYVILKISSKSKTRYE